MASLKTVIDKITAVCNSCSEIWLDMGMSEDDVETKRQAFLELITTYADDFQATQEQLILELNNSLKEYTDKIHRIACQLDQTIALPSDESTKMAKLQLLKKIYIENTDILEKRKQTHAELVRRLVYLLRGLGDEHSLILAAQVSAPVEVYADKLFKALESYINEAEEKSKEPIQRIQKYLDSIASINALLKRNLVECAHNANDSIMIDVFGGKLLPIYETHVKDVLQQLEADAKARVKDAYHLKLEVSDLIMLLQNSATPTTDTAFIVTPEAMACLQSESDISDELMMILSAELARLKEVRLAQIPNLIVSLKQEIANSKRELFGALGQDTIGGGNGPDTELQSKNKEVPSEELLLKLESDLKNLRRIEEHCEPMCMAIRRYNELAVLQAELKRIMSDTTRLTSKSREAVRARHREEELKRIIHNLLPKTLAALRLKLTELTTTMPPDLLNQLRDGDPQKPILFFGRDYEKELAEQLSTRDQKMLRKYEMYLVAYRRSSGDIEILRLRDGEDKPVKRSTIAFKQIVLPKGHGHGSAASSACGSCDSSALSFTTGNGSADDHSDFTGDLTMDALQSDQHTMGGNGSSSGVVTSSSASKRTAKVAWSRGVEASLGPEKVPMKAATQQRSASSHAAGKGNVTGVGIKSKRIPKP